MKNVKCKKLLIDRSKAPGKIGTLKDISLLGSFKFPCNGPNAGGIVARSLAGQGKSLGKTKAQVQTLSMRSVPLAGATGATVTEDMWQPSDQTVNVNTNSHSYSVQFIQLSTATPEELVLVPRNEASVDDGLRPAPGFALKKGDAKKTTFTNEQNKNMIQFYDRQRSSQIRANPADVIKAMKDAGVPELKESQIKSWWSSYHRKQKQLADDMIEEARQLRSQQQCTFSFFNRYHKGPTLV